MEKVCKSLRTVYATIYRLFPADSILPAFFLAALVFTDFMPVSQ